MVALILLGILAILVGGVLTRSVSTAAENLSDPETGGLLLSACLFVGWLYWGGSNKVGESWENAIAIGPYFYMYTVISLIIAFVSFRNFRRRRLDELKEKGIEINPNWKVGLLMIGIIITVFVVASAFKLQEQKTKRAAAAALDTERAATAALVKPKPEPKDVAPPYLRHNSERSTEPRTKLGRIARDIKAKENSYEEWRSLPQNPLIALFRLAVSNNSSVKISFSNVEDSIVASANAGKANRVIRDVTDLIEVLEDSRYIPAIPDKEQRIRKFKEALARLDKKLNG